MSALGDIAGVELSFATPRARVLHLCRYITCDDAIAKHVNRECGTYLTARRVSEIRASMPVDGRRTGDHSPLPSDMPERRARAAKANAKFCRAIERAAG